MIDIFDGIEQNDLSGIAGLISDNPVVLSSVNKHHMTPLLYALYLNKQDIAKELYKTTFPFSIHEITGMHDLSRLKKVIHTGNISSYSPDGWTSLHLAAFWGFNDIVLFLLDHGAKIDPPSKAEASPGNSPLQAAIAMNRTDTIKLLLDKGADVNFFQRPSLYTPLHIAASRNNEEIIQLLLSRGADKNAKNADGKLPMDIAVERNSGIAIKLLG